MCWEFTLYGHIKTFAIHKTEILTFKGFLNVSGCSIAKSSVHTQYLQKRIYLCGEIPVKRGQDSNKLLALVNCSLTWGLFKDGVFVAYL